MSIVYVYYIVYIHGLTWSKKGRSEGAQYPARVPATWVPIVYMYGRRVSI